METPAARVAPIQGTAAPVSPPQSCGVRYHVRARLPNGDYCGHTDRYPDVYAAAHDGKVRYGLEAKIDAEVAETELDHMLADLQLSRARDTGALERASYEREMGRQIQANTRSPLYRGMY